MTLIDNLKRAFNRNNTVVQSQTQPIPKQQVRAALPRIAAHPTKGTPVGAVGLAAISGTAQGNFLSTATSLEQNTVRGKRH